jgi:hypothetical protein
MPLLPPIAFDLSHRHALDAERERDSRTSSSLKGLMIAVISFICRPSVLLPAPDEGPALTNYQEAGQFWARPKGLAEQGFRRKTAAE